MRFPERQGASAEFLRSPDSRILFRSSGLLVLAILLRLLLGEVRRLSERVLRTQDCGRKGQNQGETQAVVHVVTTEGSGPSVALLS